MSSNPYKLMDNYHRENRKPGLGLFIEQLSKQTGQSKNPTIASVPQTNPDHLESKSI